MKVHLIGIGGTGMGALAGLLKQAGHEVRGSDGPLYPPMSTLLERLQVPVFEGYRQENLDWGPEQVVVGNICKKDHPEALEAMQRGLQLQSFPSILSELFLKQRHSVVIAGTHGKTTTSSLMTHVLRSAGHDPGFLIGGVPNGFDRSFSLGTSPYFVVEGDEYDCAFFDKRPKFVHYQPQTVILTSVEFDHADIYPTLEAVEQAFLSLIQLVPKDGRIIVCADGEAAVRLAKKGISTVETYGLSAPAQWRAKVLGIASGQQRLEILQDEQPLGVVTLPLNGAHNAANALGVIAAAHALGLDFEAVAQGVSRFQGVRRRQEVRGVEKGVTVIDDFAHHPTAIRETIDGLRGVYGEGQLVAVFEPRSATSRRRVFQREFAEALGHADSVVVGRLYAPEGIAIEQRLDPHQVVGDLSASGIPAVYLQETEAIIGHLLSTCRAGDTVLVMSSGSFDGLIERFLQALREK